MPEQPYLFPPVCGAWIPVKDGNDTARSIFDRHYSRRHYADGRDPKLFVGPGNKMVLLTQNCKALFVWRKFISRDRQIGVNCAIFRNEESGFLSSDLIREADWLADRSWGVQRHYTYIDSKKLHTARRHGREYCPWPPGRCFIEAGWQSCGWTQSGKMVLERIPQKIGVDTKSNLA